MPNITAIKGYEILDSRGNPTVAAKVILDDASYGWAAVPSGASAGSKEAIELRDCDPKRFAGKGVTRAVSHIDGIIQKTLLRHPPFDQAHIDQTLIDLDGTENKSKLGANALLAVSLAVARAACMAKKEAFYAYLASKTPKGEQFYLPTPLMNILNGGVHADNALEIQEFMIVPAGAPSFSEALRYGAEIFHALKNSLSQQHLNTNVGDEGGFAPDLPCNKAAIELILEAIHTAGYTPGKDVYLALDAASSEFYSNGYYHLPTEAHRFSSDQMIAFYQDWIRQYPIISIEDALSESDDQGWQALTQTLGKKVQLVGDDVFVTHPKIFAEGIKKGIANAILIKLNQIGTLTETLAAIQLAQSHKYATIISHRSGETEDTTISDLAVATAACQIKTGSLSRSERLAKYNRLLYIEAELDKQAIYAGRSCIDCIKHCA